jgi:serine/threonine protein kinase
MADWSHALHKGTRLKDYLIQQVLSAGGFGIVYLTRKEDTEELLVIKEYMPNKLARREADGRVSPLSPAYGENFVEGKRLFHRESAALTKLVHPNIVRVVDFFDANDTAYMVMEYRPGKNLQSYIRSHGGHLSETFLRTVFPPLLDGLRLVHDTELLHLDIKPSNIHLCPGGVPLLLDFGAVFPRHSSRKLQVAQVVTPGYSPIEQYDPSGYVGPWTDIYAMGATIRTCIEGNAPPSSKKRREKDKMEVDPLLRPQTVDEFLEALNKEGGESDDILGRLVNNLPWLR